jgi:CRISPR-associated protein Cas1
VDEYLWPVRNVAEYAYCPRLFYYMEVEGIHVPSEDTEQGQRVHRRADAPSAANASNGDYLREDQVLIIDLGENEPAARKAAVTLGESLDEPLEGTVVI